MAGKPRKPPSVPAADEAMWTALSPSKGESSAQSFQANQAASAMIGTMPGYSTYHCTRGNCRAVLAGPHQQDDHNMAAHSGVERGEIGEAVGHEEVYEP